MKYVITENKPGCRVAAYVAEQGKTTDKMLWAVTFYDDSVITFVRVTSVDGYVDCWRSDHRGPNAWQHAMDLVAQRIKELGYEEHVEKRLGPWIPAAESKRVTLKKGLVRDGDERTPYHAEVSRPYGNKIVIGTVYFLVNDFFLEVSRCADGTDDQAINEAFRRVQEALDAELRKDGFILED